MASARRAEIGGRSAGKFVEFLVTRRTSANWFNESVNRMAHFASGTLATLPA